MVCFLGRGYTLLWCALATLITSSALAGIKKNEAQEDIFRQIKESEYDVRWIEETGVHKIANRAQNLRFTLFPNGFGTEVRDYGEGNERPWGVVILLDEFGKSADQGRAVSNPDWVCLTKTKRMLIQKA